MLDLPQNRDSFPIDWERWTLRALIGVMVGLIAWIGLTAINSNKDTADAVSKLSTQMAVVQIQINTLNGNVSNVQGLTTAVTQIQVTQNDILRRVAQLETDENGRRGLK